MTSTAARRSASDAHGDDAPFVVAAARVHAVGGCAGSTRSGMLGQGVAGDEQRVELVDAGLGLRDVDAGAVPVCRRGGSARPARRWR